MVDSLGKKPHILVIPDDRLSRERSHLFMRQLHSLRRLGSVEILRDCQKQEAVLERLERYPGCPLLLAPWHQYLTWNRVEAKFGITRLKGPTFAGYFGEPISIQEFENTSSGFTRSLLVDFVDLRPGELQSVLKSLIHDNLRTGIRPWLESRTPSYMETWYSGHGLGFRMDQCLKLPGAAPWDDERGTAIRMAITALWALIYEEGPGKSELLNTVHAKIPKASFQVGCDEKAFVMRLGYRQRGHSPAEMVHVFRPDSTQPSHPAQLLMRYADFVRVQMIPDTGETEVTVVFFPSAPAERSPHLVRSHWVAPVASSLMTEKFLGEAPENDPLLLALPSAPSLLAPNTGAHAMDRQSFDRRVFESAITIRDLRRQLAEREAEVAELRAGGVGSNHEEFDPPEAEELIDALKDRIEANKMLITGLLAEMEELQLHEPDSYRVMGLKRRLNEQKRREQRWFTELARIFARHTSRDRDSA